jgi:SAM-dependent methyltransferase
MGLGCEAVFLAQRGFEVVGNEIDPRMRLKAASMAQKLGVTLRTTSCDWRCFASEFRAESVDAVLILGNSLSLLENADDRTRACSQIYSVLKPGGVFIVDQRNYDYMFENRDSVLSGSFRYSARFMYCQRGIAGRPTVIEPRRVRLSCFDKQDGRMLGFFDVYPFRGTELGDLLTAVGFRDVDEYCDFRPMCGGEWDYATFVGYKP